MELQNCMTDMLSTLASGFGDKALMLVDKDGTPAGHILGTEMVWAMEYEREKSGMRLPAGYQELAYIQNNDKQYINTGIIPTVSTDVSVILEIVYVTGSRYLFGRDGGGSGAGQFYVYLRANTYDYQWAWSSVWKTAPLIADKLKHSIRVYSDGTTSYLDIDGTNIDTATTVEQSSNLPFTLFRGGGSSPSANIIPQKVYGCTIKQSGNIVRNLVPAKRNSDNEVGMYDLVSNTFLTNAGTGTFKYGEL